jgi:hypothetical protein
MDTLKSFVRCPLERLEHQLQRADVFVCPVSSFTNADDFAEGRQL